jgi:ribonuclease D
VPLTARLLGYNCGMPVSKFSPPITKAGGLKKLVQQLADQPNIAVDTESNSLFAYREQVCLIQFSTTKDDYLVDPIALPDLAPLATIFADPGIRKIFHAAEYDLLCLKRDFGFEFASLFDTMLAARILGRKEIGLGSILEAEFSVQLDKRHQRANWGHRPLPDYLLDYARQDTHYLLPLGERLESELIDKGLLALAQEDFQRLCQVVARGDNGKTACWRVNGVHHLSPQQAAVLQELCVYRDEVARQRNRPLFKVMSDSTLQAIASTLPSNPDELKNVPGMTDHQLDRHGKALLQAVQRGLTAEPIHPPRNARPDDRFLARIEALKQWRKQKARELEVESDVILPRDLLHHLASKNPMDLEALSTCMEDVPWRCAQYGQEILGVLKKVRERT